MKETIFQAALAGLLHDIGTFARRAGEPDTDFVKRYVPAHWAGSLSGSAHHDRVITLAHQLAAGEPADDPGGRADQLQSIFLSVGQAKSLPRQYLPLKPLTIDASVIFSADKLPDPAEAYSLLWEEFKQEAQKLGHPPATPESYLVALSDLLQRYTWSIPAATYRAVADVSLYDHSRMTAALAACLIELDETRVEEILARQHQAEPLVLLAGGDISGVQKFIYTLTSSGAAKSLRGRSFYLQLLTEAVARYVLGRLGLPLTNLIYAGGGNFYLLAALHHQNDLKDIAREVTQRLLKMHDGALHLILAAHPLTPHEFRRTEFHRGWDNLHQALNRAKLQPLADLGETALAGEIGVGLGVGGDTDRLCNVCGRETSPNERMAEAESGGEPIRVCGVCDSLTDLGNDLVKATHLVILYSTPPERVDRPVYKWWQGLESFGMNVWAVNTSRPAELYLKQLPPKLRLIDWSPLSAEEGRYTAQLESELKQARAPVIKTFRLFASLVPVGAANTPLTFDELAQKTETGGHRWTGLKRWGVLRMDLDNLGQLFQKGFIDDHQENSLTLSRLASLSFSLRLFFEGWLPRLGQEPQASGRLIERLYLQYAGGDDLFVVGSWDALSEFAAKIRESFRVYTCQNPALTLSGGVSLATERYPLYQAADDAETAEKAAKNLRDRKDAFCFLGQPVGWEEFPQIMGLAYDLAGWCGDEELVSRALLQTLSSIHAEYQDGRAEALKQGRWKPDQLYFGPWMWHLVYQLGRRVEDLTRRIEHPDTPPKLRKKLEEIRAQLKQLEVDMLERQKVETVGLAARWAQYLIRKQGGPQ